MVTSEAGVVQAGEKTNGAAYVFEFEDGSWVETAVLTSPTGLGGDDFGEAVALFGEYIAVGAPGADAFGHNTGSIFLFEQAGEDWQLLLEIPDLAAEKNGGFGSRLASHRGVLVAGAPPFGPSIHGTVSTYLLDADAPVLAVAPRSQDVCEGNPVTLVAAAVSNSSVEYQWSFEGKDILDATESHLTVEEFSDGEAGLYEVVATDDCGSAIASATLELLLDVESPEFDQEPQETFLNPRSGLT